MMLEDIFLSIFNMSITATIVALFVIVIRLILNKRLSKTFSYILWVVVLIRLIIPFSYYSKFSIFNISSVPSRIIKMNKDSGGIKYISNSIEVLENPTINSLLPAPDPTASIDPVQAVTFVGSRIWFIIAISMLLLLVIAYIRTSSKLKTAIINKEKTIIDIIEQCSKRLNFKRKIKIYTSEIVQSPVVFGLVRPKIIMPKLMLDTYDKETLSYIITHEIVHIKRFDYIIKPVMIIVLSIHWFNPIIWLSFILASKDMEFSCDEKVIRIWEDDIRAEYATSLINTATIQNGIFGGGILAFGQSNINKRVSGIMKYKKPTLFLSGLAITILLITMIFTLTNRPPDILYENDEYGFSLTLPKSISGDINIIENSEVIYFTSKDVEEMFPEEVLGVIGRIEIYYKNFAKEDLKELEEIYNLKYLGENDKYYFGWATATDVQVPTEASNQLKDKCRNLEEKFRDVIKTFKINKGNGLSNSKKLSGKHPIEPPPIIIIDETNPHTISNYAMLKTSWNGTMYDRLSFYQAAWNSESTLLTGLHRPKPGEKFKIDFEDYLPDEVSVKMAYLTDSFDESLLPIVDVPVSNVEGTYEFVNPPASDSSITTSGRVFSISVTWDKNICEYVFATDGKFDNWNE